MAVIFLTHMIIWMYIFPDTILLGISKAAGCREFFNNWKMWQYSNWISLGFFILSGFSPCSSPRAKKEECCVSGNRTNPNFLAIFFLRHLENFYRFYAFPILKAEINFSLFINILHLRKQRKQDIYSFGPKQKWLLYLPQSFPWGPSKARGESPARWIHLIKSLFYLSMALYFNLILVKRPCIINIWANVNP